MRKETIQKMYATLSTTSSLKAVQLSTIGHCTTYKAYYLCDDSSCYRMPTWSEHKSP